MAKTSKDLLYLTKGLQESRSQDTVEFKDSSGRTFVVLHATNIVEFDQDKVKLDSGGFRTSKTKARMNQASLDHGLGFTVKKIEGKWFLQTENETIPFRDKMEFER